MRGGERRGPRGVVLTQPSPRGCAPQLELPRTLRGAAALANEADGPFSAAPARGRRGAAVVVVAPDDVVLAEIWPVLHLDDDDRASAGGLDPMPGPPRGG